MHINPGPGYDTAKAVVVKDLNGRDIFNHGNGAYSVSSVAHLTNNSDQ